MGNQEYKQLDDWSKTEILFKEALERRGIKFKYEPMTIDLIPNFNGTMGRQKGTFYTPDFAFKHDGKIYIIETKGFARPRDQLVFKLADKYFGKIKNYRYVPITLSGTKKDNTRDFYLYHMKGLPKRGVKNRTFWDVIGLPSEKTLRENLEALENKDES